MPTVVIAGLVGLLTLTWKLLDFVRLLSHWRDQRSAIVTQAAAWLVAVAVVFLYGASQIGDFGIPGIPLTIAQMSFATKILVGLAIGSTASAAVDLKQAIDNHDSSAVPPLLTTTARHPAEPG